MIANRKDFPNSLGLLSQDASSRVTVTARQFRDYLAEHIDLKGRPTVVCKGTVRRLHWRSLPGGYMEAWSEPLS